MALLPQPSLSNTVEGPTVSVQLFSSISISPVAPAGSVAISVLASIKVTELTAVPSNVTVDAVVKPLPLIVTGFAAVPL